MERAVITPGDIVYLPGSPQIKMTVLEYWQDSTSQVKVIWHTTAGEPKFNVFDIRVLRKAE